MGKISGQYGDGSTLGARKIEWGSSASLMTSRSVLPKNIVDLHNCSKKGINFAK